MAQVAWNKNIIIDCEIIGNEIIGYLIDNFNYVEECPICSSDQVRIIHQDYIEDKDNKFYETWMARYNREILKFHFLHHTPFSKIDDIIQDKPGYEQVKALTKIENNRNAVEDAIKGDFKGLYRKSLNNLTASQDRIQEIVDDLRGAEDLSDPISEVILHEKVVNVNDKIFKNVLEMDNLSNSKSRQAFNEKMSLVKFGLFKEVLKVVADFNRRMVEDTEEYIDPKIFKNIMENNLVGLRNQMEFAYKMITSEEK